MGELRVKLILDKTSPVNTPAGSFYLYRSEEKDNRNISLVNGVYVLREEVGEIPPENMALSLEW
ncbi:MAG: hypothetical protein HY891_01190 [Deltaproteobacteria bacterium]|nr:hypothetical protein [Deltaproteobacteria bacterium]